MGTRLDDSWERAYDEREKMKVLPKDYNKFLEFSKTAPENRRPDPKWEYGNPRQYDHYGMWDALGKPQDWEAGLKSNPDYRPNPDGLYHGYSTNPNTGIWLKSHIPGEKEPGSTAWMENLDFNTSTDSNWSQKAQQLYYDPEIQRMRYRKRALGGDIGDDPVVRDATSIIRNNEKIKFGLDKQNTDRHSYQMEHNPEYASVWAKKAQETTSRYGGIDYEHSDIRSKSYSGNPTSVFSGGQTGELAAGTENFNNALISSFLPLPGMAAPSKIRTSSQLYKNIKGGPTRLLNKDELSLLRRELGNNGILDIQKTANLPWKEPIREVITPYGYSNMAGEVKNSRLKDAISYIKNEKIKTGNSSREDWLLGSFNEKELSSRQLFKKLAEQRFDPISQSTKTMNRSATWNMYLGKPIKQHPLYDVSSLSTNNEVVYTIKPEFIDKISAKKQISEIIDEIGLWPERSEYVRSQGRLSDLTSDMTTISTGTNTYTRQSGDTMFGTMGGMDWDIEIMDNGLYKFIARDKWDLQPFLNGLPDKSPDKLTNIVRNTVAKKIRPIEVGSAIGIGKPFNVKVGFIVDPKTKKILKTFGVAPVAAGAVSESKEKPEPEYEDSWF